MSAVAAALCLLLILGVWQMSGNRGTATPGTGSLAAHGTLDASSGQVALDSSGRGLNGEYNNLPKKWLARWVNAVTFDERPTISTFPTALRLTSSVAHG
jgi:hypothetical protein